MTQFAYQALNENGNPISGLIEADSVETANQLLSTKGYIPTRVNEPGRGSGARGSQDLMGFLRPIKAPDLILFTKQFGTMIRSGIPMLTLLQVLENQTVNPGLKAALADIQQDIKEGSGLAEAFKRHPRIFSPLYCSMLHAGETSGALPRILDRLIYIIDHEHKVKSDIRSALNYPMIVVMALVIAFFVLLTFVVPQFVSIFMRAGLNLPLPTKICMDLYKLLTGYWPLLIGGLLTACTGLFLYARTDHGRYQRDRFLLSLPMIGPLFIKSAMSRFASVFSILQASGVTILDGIQILSDTIGNHAISREFDRIGKQLEQGRGIAEPLKSARYFPPMVVNMVAIGEESGNLDEMLQEVSLHYDAEVEFAMKRLSDAIGPILTVGLAAVVGFFALAIFLPMWDLTKMVR